MFVYKHISTYTQSMSQLGHPTSDVCARHAEIEVAMLQKLQLEPSEITLSPIIMEVENGGI